MSGGWAALGLLAGGGAAAVTAALVTARPPRRLLRANHAGRLVPAVLGIALWFGIAVGSIAGAVAPGDWGFLAGVFAYAMMSLLAWVGLADDLWGGEARGIAGHLRSLARGRPTTGILKLAVGVAVAILVAFHLADEVLRISAIALLVALCTNLWNALDVVPGRALKWAAVVLIPVLAVGWTRPQGWVLAAALGSVLVLLPFDLRERGMLGDTGSNPLGFLVGLGLAVVLPTPGLVAATGMALLLQVAAETVTISHLFEAAPPLRWFDRLGRGPVGST